MANVNCFVSVSQIVGQISPSCIMINSKMPLSLVLKDQRVIENVHAKEEIELALFHIVKTVYNICLFSCT